MSALARVQCRRTPPPFCAKGWHLCVPLGSDQNFRKRGDKERCRPRISKSERTHFKHDAAAAKPLFVAVPVPPIHTIEREKFTNLTEALYEILRTEGDLFHATGQVSTGSYSALENGYGYSSLSHGQNRPLQLQADGGSGWEAESAALWATISARCSIVTAYPCFLGGGSKPSCDEICLGATFRDFKKRPVALPAWFTCQCQMDLSHRTFLNMFVVPGWWQPYKIPATSVPENGRTLPASTSAAFPVSLDKIGFSGNIAGRA